jgi:hypothetical protein
MLFGGKLLTILLVVSEGIAVGQWLNHADPRTPRTRDGKPDLGATPPRRNGKPDLSGVWEAARAEQTPQCDVCLRAYPA